MGREVVPPFIFWVEESADNPKMLSLVLTRTLEFFGRRPARGSDWLARKVWHVRTWEEITAILREEFETRDVRPD